MAKRIDLTGERIDLTGGDFHRVLAINGEISINPLSPFKLSDPKHEYLKSVFVESANLNSYPLEDDEWMINTWIASKQLNSDKLEAHPWEISYPEAGKWYTRNFEAQPYCGYIPLKVIKDITEGRRVVWNIAAKDTSNVLFLFEMHLTANQKTAHYREYAPFENALKLFAKDALEELK